MNSVEKVIKAFGGTKSEVARKLGVSRQLINSWLKSKSIPTKKQALILSKAKKLKVKISPADLVNKV
jgi:transcriptional regulator with XRE-family HTH domain